MSAWIDYKPGDPLPKGRVRIRHEDGEELNTFLPASEWHGWNSGLIIAYMPEPEEPTSDE